MSRRVSNATTVGRTNLIEGRGLAMTRRSGARLTIPGMRGAGCLAAALAAALVLAPRLVSAQVVGEVQLSPIAPTAEVVIGPGTLTSAQQFSSGTIRVVGNTTIAASGSNSFNITSPAIGILDTTNGPITISNATTFSVAVFNGATITSVGPGLLTVTSNGSASVFAGVISGQPIGQPTMLSLQNFAVTNTANSGIGVSVRDGATATLNNGTVFATGASASALALRSVGVSTQTLTATGVKAEATGAGSSALSMLAGTNIASLTDSTLKSANGPAIAASTGANNLTLVNSSVTGPVEWLSVPSGTLNLTASGSSLSGATNTADAATSNVALQSGTLWTMTGSSTLTNLTNDASTINFTPPVADPSQLASYKTLTVMNYTGANGTIGLNTFLGADASPSDRLVISGGSATGTTFLSIANTIGLGALTTGAGILVVDAINGAITDDAFRLAGPVIAGPFEYMLFKGNDNPEAWYLRSTLNCALPGAPTDLCPPPPDPPPCPVPPAVGPTPPPPVAPTAPAPPGQQVPNFRQEVSLYSAIPNLALLYGRKAVGTLHDRVGDEVSFDRAPPPVAVTSTALGDGSPGARPRATPYVEEAPVSAAHGAWGRVFAEHGDRNGGCPVLIGPSFDYWFTAVQGGFDALRWQHRDGSRDRAGVFGTIGDAQADVDGRFSDDLTRTGNLGRDSFAAYSVGAYWTHYGAWGWYLDSVVQGTFYDAKAQSVRIPALETDGWGFAASIEAGYPVKGLLGGWAFGGLSIEPQAQLVYQSIDLGDTRDIAAQVRFDDVESLAGRVGVRFATSGLMPALWGLHPPLATTAWFRPSYWHEFNDDPRTLFSSEIGFLPFRANIAENWVELNTGLAVQVDRHTALFTSGSYDIDTEGDGEAWQGKIGLKVSW
jgi:outer membrane autotransporter protein